MLRLKNTFRVDRYLASKSLSFRVISILIFELFVLLQVCISVRKLASFLSVKCTPYILLFILTNPHILIIIMLGFIVLFCNASSWSDNLLCAVSQISKKQWVYGKIVHIYSAAALYVMFILISFCLLMNSKLELSSDWGNGLYTMAQISVPSQYKLNFTIPYIILLRHNPLISMLAIGLIFWLNGVLLGQVSTLINTITQSPTGIVIAVGIILASIFTLNSNGYTWYYISPISWTSITLLATSRISPFPTTSRALICLIVANTLFSIGLALLYNKKTTK